MEMNSKIKDYLQSVEISHLFAKDYKHGIAKTNGQWDLFEPTRFIYAFFAFNMLYSIDWPETLNRNRLWYHHPRK